MAAHDLPKCEANYGPLSPITFLQRTASVYPDRESVIYGERRFTWAQTLERCHRIASALRSHSILRGDTVAVVAPNVPAVYELHFAVPMAGAVLNAINMRLDARTVATILSHSDAKMVFVDTEFLPVVQDALRMNSNVQPSAAEPLLVHVEDRTFQKASEMKPVNFQEYEDFVRSGDPKFPIQWPKDEWDTISINYTSGTTSHPKGVVYSHRGAYLHALVTALDWSMQTGPTYLWTLPMFHANGWCFTWTVAAQGGTNICLRNLSAKSIFDALHKHRVTHMCGAPVVLTLMANAPEHEKKIIANKVHIMTAAAPPPAALLATMESDGFSLTHAYGLTESYGPAVSCVWKDEWNSLPPSERAKLKARQGVGNLAISGTDVFDPNTMIPVPRDGQTIGEVMMRGNIIMKGYLKDQQATEDSFKGGWFHTGDLGVMNPDGYIQLKDRSKDIIISGGENISSIEVESILYQHPHILEAAVVARPDEFWGETPCAFVTLKDSCSSSDLVSEKSIIEYCRDHLPHYKIPRTVVFGTLPKTVTGKVRKNVLRDWAKLMGSLTVPVKSKL